MKTINLFPCLGVASREAWVMSVLIVALNLLPAGRVTAQTFTTLHSFTGGSDGVNPFDGLVVSGNTLYGTALRGGSSGNGTVFAVNTDGTGFATLHSFAAGSGSFLRLTNSDGAEPYAGLILSGHTLYGAVTQGGSSGSGTLFAVNTNGTGFTNLHSFTAATLPHNTNSDGAYPLAGLILSGNTLYGTAVYGGSSGAGTVFAINTESTVFTNLHSFTALSSIFSGTNGDGAQPYGGLILSGNTLYGTAAQGGSSGNGTVFAVNTNGTGFTTLHSFVAVSDGAHPHAGLILSGNTLYGTANEGGSSGVGTVFAINTDGTGFTNLHTLTGSDGAYPESGLILSGNTLYGTTYLGGSSGAGTVFAVNTDGTGFSNLYTFTGGGDGAYPIGGLILSGNTLYGTTRSGGSSGNGTVFKLLLNRAPSSVANVAPLFAILPAETNRFILSPNSADATVVLDGSQSSDPDNDPLQFAWYADGQTTPLATGAIATLQFAVGPHTVQLVVSDGQDTATAQVSFEVITPATAVGQLMLRVDDANLGRRNKQPLLATLSAAMSSFVRGNLKSALNQLSAFQNKVRTQVAPWNSALANELITASQKISKVVGGR